MNQNLCRTKSLLYKTLIVVAGILATVYLAFGVWALLSPRFIRPVVYTKIELLTAQPVRAGDTLRFRSHRIKRTVCSAVFDRFVLEYRYAGAIVGRVVQRDSVPGGYSPPGEGYVEFDFKLAADIPPGEYQYV